MSEVGRLRRAKLPAWKVNAIWARFDQLYKRKAWREEIERQRGEKTKRANRAYALENHWS